MWAARAGETNREENMIGDVRMIQLASAAIVACALIAGAPASAQGVKIRSEERRVGKECW